MPHLAPISWLTIMSISWFTLLVLAISMWWHQPLQFKATSMKQQLPSFSQWNWSMSK
uniref:ATP synthase subunit 8 n=1 Tax=Urechis caupo TaxID=6431 RepID=Q5YA37_URECA|nr:ATP synthase F0 subunit 8 [Urechis caupo]AAT12182.1 ATP synthase subunit 8 [Urechis caupo]